MTLFGDIGSAARPSARRAWTAAIIVAALQTTIIGYMIESRASILRSGAEVLLKTAPVDPRDLLRGDYVVLNYDISRVPIATLTGDRPKTAGERVLWVRLQRMEDGFWGVAESSFQALQPKPDTVILESLPFDYSAIEGDEVIHVDYGIERYYVPEGRGRDLETARTDGRITVAARISGDGAAQIRSLLLDGRPVYDEPLY